MTIRSASLGAASLLAAAILAGPALADGMPSRGKIAGAPEPRCSTAANVGLTTDYVFRGISQNNENAALQGGVDFTCGSFYLGVWGSNVAQGDGTLEVDVYGGYKMTTGPIAWDFGFIYYSYPGADSVFDLDFLELKVNASGDIWKGGTLGGTVFYSPEYTTGVGPVWTLEATFAQALPKFAIFTPTFSATVGTSRFSDDSDLDYTYWNAGVTLGFREKWSLDLRYWDSTNEGFAAGPLGEERFIGTVKYTF
jgi:uncharacterized protein (TIGR02001 family)